MIEDDRAQPPIDLRDRDAVEAIYRRDGPAIRSFLRHCLSDPPAADDALQDTFLELWRKPNGYDAARGSIRQYLFGIARRRAAQWRRDNPAAAGRPSVVPLASVPVDATAIRHALMQLDDDARALLWLREVEGYSYAELASVLEVPLGTIKSRLFTARTEMRRVWLSERERLPRTAMR